MPDTTPAQAFDHLLTQTESERVRMESVCNRLTIRLKSATDSLLMAQGAVAAARRLRDTEALSKAQAESLIKETEITAEKAVQEVLKVKERLEVLRETVMRFKGSEAWLFEQLTRTASASSPGTVAGVISTISS